MLRPTYFQNNRLRYKNFNMIFVILMIHLCVRPKFSPCLLLRSAFWAKGRFIFYIQIFSAVFSVLGNLMTFLHRVSSDPWSHCHLWFQMAQCHQHNSAVFKCQMSYSSGISLRVCIMDCDSGWCNNIVSASLIYSLRFPYSAVFYQLSFH